MEEHRFSGEMIETFKIWKDVFELDPWDIYRQATEGGTQNRGANMWHFHYRLNVCANFICNRMIGA